MNCLQNIKDFKLQGDYYSEEFSYLEVILRKCTKGSPDFENTTCENDETINKFFSS